MPVAMGLNSLYEIVLIIYDVNILHVTFSVCYDEIEQGLLLNA